MRKITRHYFLVLTALILAVFTFDLGWADQIVDKPPITRPTVVLVHGAFAESASWNASIAKLAAKRYPVIAVANPLRGLKSDSEYVAGVLATVKGSIILVGHSYGGAVISAASGNGNVKALIYVSGLAPDIGESVSELVSKFPGSTLGPNLAPPVTLRGGGKDLYIRQDRFHARFAADLPLKDTILMPASQRPIDEAAFGEKAESAAWKAIPSWFLYGSLYMNIPPAVHAYMAQRANAREAVKVRGASHVLMMSHPDALVRLVEAAAVTIPR